VPSTQFYKKHTDTKILLKNPAKTSQGWLAGFGWSPSLVIVGLSGWF